MVDKICIRCKCSFLAGGETRLCQSCIDEMATYIDLYYDTRYLAGIMGISERTVRRRVHSDNIFGMVWNGKQYLFKKDVIDEWERAGFPIPFIPDTQITPIIPLAPTNPLQEEAAAKCRKHDHSWFSDSKFDGIAYTSEPSYINQSEYSVLAGNEITCYFCKYKTFLQI